MLPDAPYYENLSLPQYKEGLVYGVLLQYDKEGGLDNGRTSFIT